MIYDVHGPLVVSEVLVSAQCKLPCVNLTMLAVCRESWVSFRPTNMFCRIGGCSSKCLACCTEDKKKKVKNAVSVSCITTSSVFTPSLAWNCKCEFWSYESASCIFTEWMLELPWGNKSLLQLSVAVDCISQVFCLCFALLINSFCVWKPNDHKRSI